MGRGEGQDGGTGLVPVVSATLSIQALGAWGMLALAAIAPTVAEAFDIPAVLIGYQITIYFGVAMPVSLIAGALVMRWGACRVGQISVLGCALGCLLAMVPSLYAIALASALLGMSYGLTNPSSIHLLARYAKPENRSLVFSIKQTGMPIGGILAGLLTPWVAVTWGWQAGIGVIVPFALLLLILLNPPREVWDNDRVPSSPIAAGSISGIRQVFHDPPLRWLCATGFFFSIVQLCLMTFIVSLAMTELGFGAIAAGYLLATIQASGVVGRLAWGYLADRLQRNSLVLVVVAGITALCSLALAWVDTVTPVWLVFAVAAAFGASGVGWNGVFIAEVVRRSPSGMVGRVNGIITFSNYTGILIGPLMFVQLHGVLGSYGTVYGLLAIPTLLGALGVVMASLRGAAGAQDSSPTPLNP